MKKKRILTALNSSPESLSALKAAVGLAEKMEAELAGLYVEDVNLLNLVAHPCTASLSPLGVKAGALGNDGLVEILLKMQGENARKALESMAAASGVVAVWKTIRGRVCETLLASACGADMVFLGWNDRLSPSFKLGSTAKFMAQNANVPVMLLKTEGNFINNEIFIVSNDDNEIDMIKCRLKSIGMTEGKIISNIRDVSLLSKLGPRSLVAIGPGMLGYIEYMNCSLLIIH